MNKYFKQALARLFVVLMITLLSVLAYCYPSVIANNLSFFVFIAVILLILLWRWFD